MAVYLLRRLVALIPVWLGVTAVAFAVIHAVPGGPFDTDAVRTPAVDRILREHYHLNDSYPVQYGRFIFRVVRGDLGESMINRGLSVNEVVRDRFPRSLLLGISGIIVALAVGIPAGLIAAARRNRWADRTVMFVATLGYALPSFVLAILLILFVGLKLGWLPLGGWGRPSQIVLPAITLGIPWSGLVARHTRSAVIAELGKNYVVTAHAKGLGAVRVLVRHAFRNALIPIMTVFGVLAAEMITGSLVVESIFGIPGMGRYVVDSILASDYSMTLGLVVFYASVIFLANALVDVLYVVANPRIRLSAAGDHA